METVVDDYMKMEETHGANVLNLVLAAGYLKRLIIMQRP